MKFKNLFPDLPFARSFLPEAFKIEHQRYTETYPGWSLQSTRRKLMALYWFKIVPKHFFFLLAAGSSIVWLIKSQSILVFLQILFPVSVLIFLVLFWSMYWPIYQLDFLPHLDTCLEVYKGDQLDGIQACKKQQYSVLTLMLIQIATMEIAGMKIPSLNTSTALFFVHQYGVSEKSIGPALQLIVRGDWNRKSLRKRTEILDDFETAKAYFLELSEARAIVILEKMQQRVLR